MDAQMSSEMSSEMSSQMSDESTGSAVTDGVGYTPTIFSAEELAVLDQLRTSYQVLGDMLTPDEVARLKFVRWLYATGRLAP